MPSKDRTIYIPPKGDGSGFNIIDLTPEYATEFTNFNMNSTGGITTIETFTTVNATVNNNPTGTSANSYFSPLFEFIKRDGSHIYFVNVDGILIFVSGNIENNFPNNTVLNTNGLFPDSKKSDMRAVQFGTRMLFCNGTSRNWYTEDGGVTVTAMPALMEQGIITSTSASATQLSDSDITNWLTQTQVTNNDLVFNLNKEAYGIITAVTSGAVQHTRIDASALGIGAAASAGAPPQGAGDNYRIEDLVELNIIPIKGQEDMDNVAVAGTNTTATGIYFTAASKGQTGKYDWTTTEIRAGDYILNTTRNAATMVTAVTTSVIRCAGITTQVAGDSLVFLKSAMPIATNMHVHFGRLYMIDARDTTKVRISGPNDPFDMSTDAATLDSTSLEFGELQPESDRALAMGTFQRFFVLGGSKNVYLFEGTDPVVDVSAASTITGGASTSDFNIVGIFPQGVVGPDSMLSIGNDLLFVTRDGVQSISMGADSSTLNRADISEAVKETFVGSSLRSIIHYPQNSWILFNLIDNASSVRSTYCYNYHPYLGRNREGYPGVAGGQTVGLQGGTWQKFSVDTFSPHHFLVNTSGRFFGLIQASAGTAEDFNNLKIVEYGRGPSNSAQMSSFDFTATMRTSWLNLNEPKESNNIKEGLYHTSRWTYIDTSATAPGNYNFNITWVASAIDSLSQTRTKDGTTEGGSTDSFNIKVSAATNIEFVNFAENSAIPTEIGSNNFIVTKNPLLWKGQLVRFSAIVSVRNTYVTLSRFNVQFNEFGEP